MKYISIEELPDLRIPWFGRPPLDVWVKLKQFIYDRDAGICQYCSQPIEYIKSHCHHVLELSEGGTNHPSNLKTLCHGCHKNRHPFMLSAKEKLNSLTKNM